MKDYNDDDRKFFDKAAISIFTAVVTEDTPNETIADYAFRTAIMLTVKRKSALNDLEEEIECAQRNEDEKFQQEMKEYREKKAAIMATPDTTTGTEKGV